MAAIGAVFVVTGFQSAAAQIAAGKLTAVQGQVFVVRPDDTRAAASADMPLFPGDSIVTGANGSAIVVLNKTDRYSMDPESETAVDEMADSDDDDPPVLQLQLGQVLAQISKIFPGRTRAVIQTPTAMVGVRGTEFEVAVAMDAACAASVRQGAVEIKTDEAALTLAPGQSAEVDADGHPPRPLEAFNGMDWRRRRQEKLLANLPENAPALRKQFGKAGRRFLQLTDNTLATASRLNQLMDQVDQARDKGQQWETMRLHGQVRMNLPELKDLARHFREARGRMHAFSRLTERVDQFAAASQDRFSPEQYQQIREHLTAIAGQRPQLKQRAATTITTLRQTFARVKEMGLAGGGMGERDRPPGKRRGR
jgi:hypothetical protein